MAMSRLKAAWAALGLGVAGLMAAAVLAPPPRALDPGVEIALPARPDRFAPGPAPAPDAATPAPAAPGPLAAARGDGLPRIVLGEAPAGSAGAPGEVVITVGEASAAPGPDPAPVRGVGPAVPPAAPAPALTAKTPSGTRPGVGPEGRTPFAAYRRLQPVGEARGVAVVLSGLGLDAALTEAATRLPPEVSLAFAPYAKDLPGQVERARRAGHEVLIELPMGTPGVAPAALGPAGLLAERSPKANAERLAWLLSRAPAYPMVTNYLGRGFSGDEAAMGRLMAELSVAGLAYVDDTGLAEDAARASGVPYARAAMLIEPDQADVAERLGALAKRSAPGEVALAKLYATPASVAALGAWAERLPDGTALVPASTAVSAR